MKSGPYPFTLADIEQLEQALSQVCAIKDRIFSLNKEIIKPNCNPYLYLQLYDLILAVMRQRFPDPKQLEAVRDPALQTSCAHLFLIMSILIHNYTERTAAQEVVPPIVHQYSTSQSSKAQSPTTIPFEVNNETNSLKPKN